MVNLSRVVRALGLASVFFLRVAADSQGSSLWDPPVDNEANVYARVIELQHAADHKVNGRLLATWEHWYTTGPDTAVGNGTAGGFIIRASDDGSDSWATLTTVEDTASGPQQPLSLFWQPFLFEFPVALGKYAAGTLLLVGNLVPQDKSTTNFYTWRSTDHGTTWKAVGHRPWQTGGPPSAGIWEPFLYLDKHNRLVAVFSDERQNTAHSQMLVHVVSTDGGDSWGDVVVDVASDAQSDRPGMATVARLPSGQYAMSYEVCGRPGCPVHVKTGDGTEWRAADIGSPVVSDHMYAGSSPYMIWDPSTEQLVLSSHAIWDDATDTQAPPTRRAVFTNSDKNGAGAWSWSPAPWAASNASAACNANYSPHLLPLQGGTIRYTTPSSEGASGLCSERTGAAPVGVLPYRADFAAHGQLGWFDLGGSWSVDGDAYSVGSVGNIDARAVTGSSGWTDYTVAADAMIVGSSGVVGLNARVTSPWNGLNAFKGYTAAINSFTGNLTLSREAHAMVVLSSVAHPGGVVGNTWYHLSLTVHGHELTASVSSATGKTTTTVTAVDNSFPQGMAGLLVNDGAGSFSNVHINKV
ncbi:hypothetical protein SPBR_04877 [Sporothrix brasiliensis 5110]|uniref:Uncharacterized protein n=1 Tax=Sporothrix brasiliensis 5110 TaxID=1398154 RepID=A0A0C2IQG9_9PEZI|nr:uncharacterized protein SPBR_04877 [Sporothrix brasiliensis 5110]KIH87307.1 hypothetical protein SPBR_04877 [Sporothrix brasiliensis 5110]